jgi:hypothetical protein
MREIVTEVIHKCLASCSDCTGRYVSNLLRKRFICKCSCHDPDKLVS